MTCTQHPAPPAADLAAWVSDLVTGLALFNAAVAKLDADARVTVASYDALHAVAAAAATATATLKTVQ